MSLKSDKSGKVFIVRHGCPLCGSDVVGNDELGYYCKHCNLLFSLDELDFSYYKKLNNEERANKKDNTSKDSNIKIGVNINNSPEADVNSCQSFFVASKESNKFHIPECPFAKNILPKNKIVFKSKEEAIEAGFKPCRCVD